MHMQIRLANTTKLTFREVAMMVLVTLVSLLIISTHVVASFGTTLCSSEPSKILMTYNISHKCPTYLLSPSYQLKNLSATNPMQCAVRCTNAGKSLMFNCGVDSASFSFRCYGFKTFCLTVYPVLSCSNGVSQHDGSCMCRPGFYGRFCEKYFRSCEEVYIGNDRVATNGTYVFETYGGVSIVAKCEFGTGHILTFFTRASLAVMSTEDLARHYNNASQFILRRKYTDNNQKDSIMEQISYYNTYNLTFVLNHNNTKSLSNLGVYLYIEFAPVYIVTKGTLNGYRANGIDYAFTNCDLNHNSFMVLFPSLVPSYKGHLYPKYSRNWEDGSYLVEITEQLPDDFFLMFEIAFGGCGCRTANTWWPDIVGFNAGFKYVIPA